MIQLLNVLSPVLVAVATGLMAVLLARVNHRIKKDEQTDEVLKTIEENQKSISANMGAIETLNMKHEELEKTLNRSQRANTVLLRDSMRSTHKRLMEQGSVTSHQLQDFEEAYNIYHESGGNGTATKYYEDIRKLDVKD